MKLKTYKMNHDSQCPLCQVIKDTDNIKLCQKHADELDWSITPEIELVGQYSHN